MTRNNSGPAVMLMPPMYEQPSCRIHLEQISKVQHRRNMRGRSVGLVETRKDSTLNVSPALTPAAMKQRRGTKQQAYQQQLNQSGSLSQGTKGLWW
jgi:hypothetical protein